MNEHLEHNNLISRWLKGDLSPEEGRQLKESGELDDLKYVLDDITSWKVRDFDVKKGLADLERRKAKKEAKTITFRPYLRIAASIVLLVAAYFTWHKFINTHETLVTTTIGEKQQHEFPGGSFVTIDALSEIRYDADSWHELRKVNLKGQAFFTVTKGKPFTVISDLGTVQVLGTQFNVKASDSTFNVTCYEGNVRVTVGNDSLELSKGMAVSLKNGRLQPYEATENQPDWLGGFTVYDKEPLAYVVEDLKRYYKIKINLPSKYARLKFTGKVPHDDLAVALKTIFIPMEIPYTLNEENEVIFK